MTVTGTPVALGPAPNARGALARLRLRPHRTTCPTSQGLGSEPLPTPLWPASHRHPVEVEAGVLGSARSRTAATGGLANGGKYGVRTTPRGLKQRDEEEHHIEDQEVEGNLTHAAEGDHQHRAGGNPKNRSPCEVPTPPARFRRLCHALGPGGNRGDEARA